MSEQKEEFQLGKRQIGKVKIEKENKGLSLTQETILNALHEHRGNEND